MARPTPERDRMARELQAAKDELTRVAGFVATSFNVLVEEPDAESVANARHWLAEARRVVTNIGRRVGK